MTTTTTERPSATAEATPMGVGASVAQEDLARALRFVRTPRDRRASALVLLEHDGTALTVTGQDWPGGGATVEATSRVLCPGRPGRSVVPAGALAATVQAIGRRATVFLSATSAAEDTRLTVEGAGVSYALTQAGPDDWSSLEAGGAVLLATMTGEAMAAAARPAYAASHDETLPILTAVRVHVDDGQLVTAATDRYRLARATADVEVGVARRDVLVPARPLLALADRWRAARTVAWDLLDGDLRRAGYVRWSSGGETWTQVLIDGEYPKIDALLPDVTGRRTWVDVDRAALLAGFARVSVLAAQGDPLRLQLVQVPQYDCIDYVLRLTASSSGGEATLDVPVERWDDANGDPDRITAHLNTRFAPELLRSLTAATARLYLDDAQPSNRPVVAAQSPVRPALDPDDLAAAPEPDDTLVSLLMPVRTAG